MKVSLKAGTTSYTCNVFIMDSSSTTGAGKTGLAFNTASLTAYYVRPKAAAVAITLATQTVTGAFSSGGFVEIDSTNMPGMYRLDLPDAAIASGANSVAVLLKGASGMAPVALEIELTAWDNQDSVRGGMTALPNAAAGASNGLPLSVDSSGRVDVLRINGTSQTARDIGASVLLSSGTGTGQVSLSSGAVTVGTNNDKTGYALSSAGVQAVWDALTSALTTVGSIGKRIVDNLDAAITTRLASASYTAPLDAAGTRTAVGLASANLDTQLAAIQADTDNIQTRLPVALVSGRIDASVGAMAAGVVTAAAIATDAIDADAVAADAVAEIQSGLSTLTAAGVRTAVGLASANLDTQLDALPTAAETADAVWDEAISGHLSAGSTGNALNAAGSAGDPWSTALPGAYGAGTAGKIIGDNIDATISSRLASASYTAPLDAAATRTAVGLASANLDTQLSGIQSDTNDIQTRIPAALVGGRIDASVGAMAANTLTASALATDAVTEIQSGLSTLDAAGVRTAVGLASANLDTQLDALPTATENADEVLKRDWSGLTGEAARSLLNAARILRNRVVLSGGTVTVYKEDGATAAFTMTAGTSASADPIISLTP